MLPYSPCVYTKIFGAYILVHAKYFMKKSTHLLNFFIKIYLTRFNQIRLYVYRVYVGFFFFFFFSLYNIHPVYLERLVVPPSVCEHRIYTFYYLLGFMTLYNKRNQNFFFWYLFHFGWIEIKFYNWTENFRFHGLLVNIISTYQFLYFFCMLKSSNCNHIILINNLFIY